MVKIEFIFLLLFVFQIKHFLADYMLQNEYMLGKFKPGWDFVTPLAAHCGVHALMTFAIAAGFIGWQKALLLAVLDFVLHFIMDRIKASPHILGKYDHQQPHYWQVLGLDQTVHHLTHYLIIYIIIMNTIGVRGIAA